MTLVQGWRVWLAFMMCCSPLAGAMQPAETQGYVAAKEGVRQFFDALAAQMEKPVIVSALAAKKKISGNFDFSRPQQLLESITSRMGLVWYFDGTTLYVYDASELKNGVIGLQSSSVAAVEQFLVAAGVYDERYPLRSAQGGQTFYLSAPPVYFELVVKAANRLDQQTAPERNALADNLIAIPLYNSFVEDRKYRYRDETITIPGIASVVRMLTANGSAARPAESVVQRAAPPLADDVELMNEEPDALATKNSLLRELPAVLAQDRAAGPVQVIANPDNNSLLVRGGPQQLSNIRRLVALLDVPKRHVEMSVWIIDLQKDELEQLGVKWSGSLNVGGQLGVAINGGLSSTVDGASFMATVLALAEQNRANVVSRPMLLTQENVPAIFDNSRTFYTRLVGERSTSLEHVTYGTSLSVLPRFSDREEIEMMLSVEDGNQYRQDDAAADSLPEIGRTNISTVARVPKGKSLLIGGYTRDELSNQRQGIPLLKDIPLLGRLFSYQRNRSANMVRLFLIQPKEIESRSARDGNRLVAELRNKPAEDPLFDWMHNFLDARR